LVPNYQNLENQCDWMTDIKRSLALRFKMHASVAAHHEIGLLGYYWGIALSSCDSKALF